MVRAEDALHFKANVETETHRSRKLSIPLTSQKGTFTMTVPAFETTFAVPMTCEACIKDIEGSLSSLSGTSARSSPLHVIRLT